MSWSASVGKTPDAEFEAAIDAAVLPVYPNATAYATAEALEQFAAAKEAAKALFRSGAIGNGKEYAASFSGHANPGHEDTPGWSGDSVTVNIYRASY